MPDAPSLPGKFPEAPLNEPRLESWGEIANYLRRDIRTVQRWEHLHGLPVRRLVIGKQGQVYAYRSELDTWVRKRQPNPEDDIDQDEKDQDRPPVPGPSPGPQPKPQPEPRAWWKMAIVGLLLLASLGWVNPVHDWLQDKMFSTPKKRLLFVRPFASLPADPEQELFVRGLKDEMITQLGDVDPSHLGVFAPTTSDSEGSKSIGELRTSLQTDYVLEGSVRRAADKLRIDAVLISTRDGSQVFSKSYTGDAQNILSLQDNVTQDVSAKIRGTLPTFGEHGGAKGQPVDPKAYEAYLEGRVHWFERDLLHGKESYERALQIDPGYSRARAGLAMIDLLMGQSPNDVVRPSVSFPLARKAAEAALESDPGSADAYCVLGNIAQSYDHDMPGAERFFQKALALEPSNVTAHEWYGYFLLVNNRLPEALQETQRALELDPASPLIQNVQGEVYYYKRDYDAAIRQELQTLARAPGFVYPRIWLASAYREKKLYKQALGELEIARKESTDSPALLGLYGHALARSGDKTGAQRVLVQLQQLSQQRYVPALYFAAIYTGLGDTNRSLYWLEQAYTEQNDRLVYLGVDPIADTIRGDQRFQEIMKRSGLH
jgi:TolB-like protein/tetratricopeptide (TPR) repeat protein